jgi:hypothetical protein
VTTRPSYLHIDEFTMELPAGADASQVLAHLQAAASRRVGVTIKVVDNDGDNIEALLMPASARVIVASPSQIAPRKTRPGGN